MSSLKLATVHIDSNWVRSEWRPTVEKPERIRRVLLINPFAVSGPNPNIGMDPVVSRHAGQEIKTGVTLPIGLCYLAAVLLKRGFEVKLLDPLAEEIPIAEIMKWAEWSDAIVMPFSARHTDDTRWFLERLQHKYRVLGGSYAKHIPEKLLGQGFCDAILVSEPEFIVADLFESYPKVSRVKGVIFAAPDGSLVKTERLPPIDDLDSIPFPARHLVDPKKYWDISFWGEPTTWLLPTRGCPFSCNFCAQFDLNEKAVRYRSPKNIVDEMVAVVEESGVRNFVFFDETFNLNKKFVMAVCEELLAREVRVRWWCAARADLVDRDVVRLMKRAGCIEMRCGLESANDEILKYLQKNMTVDGVRRGCEIMNDEGMNFSLQCILGTPMETRETVARTMAFIAEVRPLFVSFNILTPLPGSQLFREMADKLDLDQVRSFDILHTDYPLGAFTSEELGAMIRRCYLSYYVSFGFLRKVVSIARRDPRMVPGIGKTLLRQGRYIAKSVLLRSSARA